MDDKEPKTKEGLVSPEGASPERLTGLQNAQHVTLNDKIRQNQIKTQGVSQLAKSLLNVTEQ